MAGALGDPPRSLRLLSTDAGPVLFVTVGLRGEPGLLEAHRLASELEVTLRERHPGLAEVVVHTEPAPPGVAGLSAQRTTILPCMPAFRWPSTGQ